MPMNWNDSPLNFPVLSRTIAFAGKDGQFNGNAPGLKAHKAIVRAMPDGSPRVLGIVGNDYALVPNEQLYDAIEHGLRGSGLDGAETVDRIAKGGSWGMRKYTFPNIAYDLEQRVGTQDYRTTRLTFSLEVKNSYDGTKRVSMDGGCIDGFCDNGLIFMGAMHLATRKHTKGFAVPNFSRLAALALEQFHEQAQVMQQWAKSQITSDQAKQCLEECKMSERRVKQILAQFEKEQANRGATAWSLVSAMTYYASHNSESFPVRNTKDADGEATDNEALALNERAMQVMNWLPRVRELVAA